MKTQPAAGTIKAVLYRGFPSKLYHDVPSWVEDGALFHIRIALNRGRPHQTLTTNVLAPQLLDSVCFYEAEGRWFITLFLLMPDHVHAILSFAPDKDMGRVVGDWKHFQSHSHGIVWEEGYFDHRLREDERGEQLSLKTNYIRQNPVVAGLCATADEWPWVIQRAI